MPSLVYLLLLFILGVLLPINGVLSGKRIKAFLIDNPDGRMLFYKQTIIIQIVLAVLVFGAMAFQSDSIDVIGLSFLKQPIQLIGLLGLCFLGWWLLRIYPYNPQSLVREIERSAAVKFLLPQTDEEYRWSIGVSFAAGICEEIVFRGFLYWQLAQYIPLIPAVILTNFIFALCHFGTGIKNASLAFGLGILFSVIFLYTGSLWLPMLVHVLTDIYSMTKGRIYFEIESREQRTEIRETEES